jgi:hypothetical protein
MALRATGCTLAVAVAAVFVTLALTHKSAVAANAVAYVNGYIDGYTSGHFTGVGGCLLELCGDGI